MAGGRRGQSSDITLGGGHVAGIFFGVVLLCGIFFALGYVMGRGSTVKAVGERGGKTAAVVDASGNLTGQQAPPTPTWDFYPNKSKPAAGSSPVPGLTKAVAAHSQPNAAPAAAEPPPPSGPVSMAAKPRGVKIESQAPSLPSGGAGVSLQVAALKKRGDAVALAGFLRQRGYPAVAWGPGPGHLYRVQVGPYPNVKAADAVKRKLEQEGFKSLLKK